MMLNILECTGQPLEKKKKKKKKKKKNVDNAEVKKSWRRGGFPGGAVVENLSACQCRGHRFEPWSGRIPHAAEQLGP